MVITKKSFPVESREAQTVFVKRSNLGPWGFLPPGQQSRKDESTPPPGQIFQSHPPGVIMTCKVSLNPLKVPVEC